MVEIYLTFSAFILAFFALMKRIIEFRLNSGIFTFKKLTWCLICLGGVAALNFIYPYIPQSLRSLLHSDNVIAQILLIIGWIIYCTWYLCLVCIVIYLFYILTHPRRFSSRNAKKFFDDSYLIISSGVEADIEQLATEIFYSFSKIYNSCLQKKDNETFLYSRKLILLFSDDFLARSIVNRNPRTLEKIFAEVIGNHNKIRNSPATLELDRVRSRKRLL